MTPARIVCLTVFSAIVSSPMICGGQEREAKAAAQEIEALLKESKELQEAGKLDRADVLRRQAAELKEKLARFKSLQERQVPPNKDDGVKRESPTADNAKRARLIKQVFTAVEALQALGRVEAAERLAAVGRELLREGKANKPATQNENAEIKALRERMAAMKIAVDALKEAKKTDFANQLSRSLLASKLIIERQSSQKIDAARKSAPSLGQQIELLMFASRLLREQKQLERSTAVERLADSLRARFKKQR